MKKIILSAILFISALVANAQQVEVTVQGGTVIEDGYTFTTSSLALPSSSITPNKLKFNVKNLTEGEMYVGAKLVSMSSNSTGQNTQLCFGSLCIPNVAVGTVVPQYEALEAGATTPSDDDHFINSNAATDGGAITFQIAIVKLNMDQETMEYTEGETFLTFNYVYQPTAGTSDFDKIKAAGISLNSTVVASNISFTATTAGTLNVFDMSGKKVRTAAFASGSQSIETSSLSAGIYTAQFTTSEKKSGEIKIVKQ